MTTPPVTRSTLLLPGPDDEPTEVAARGWKSVRRGLGSVRVGVVLLVIAVVAAAVVTIIHDKSPGTLPDKRPGYLGINELSTGMEIRVASGVVPGLLGVLAVVLGRAGVGRAPRSSYTRGLARLAALGTVLAFAGLVAAATPAVLLLTQQVLPPGLAMKDDHNGMVQRFGLAFAVGFGLAAELWFLVAIGKIGAALHQRKASGRSGGLIALFGLALGAGVVAYVALTEYGKLVNEWWADNVVTRWDQLGDNQLAVTAGACAVLAVIVGIFYLRAVGAARGAVREWLAQHHVG